MTKIYNLFFELIQVTIGRRNSLSRVPSSEEWNMLYNISVKQAVAGVCFCGLQRLPANQLSELPKRLMMQWLALAEGIRQRNVLMNNRCVELLRMMNNEGLRCAILKGQGVAALYNSIDSEWPQLGLYRQSGDIDVWVDGGMDSVLNWCRKNYGDVDFDYINAHVPVCQDVEVEVHWRVGAMTNLFRNKRLQRWLESDKTKAMILGGKSVLKSFGTLQPSETTITVPTLEFNAFYLMLHCYHHMFESGLGLRQLMDYYFLLMARSRLNLDINKNENRDNFQKLNHSVYKLFKEFGMTRFVGAMMWIMQEVFGLERERLFCEPDEKEGRYILAEVMVGGNFGHHDERIKRVGKGKWQSVFATLQHAMHLLKRYPSEALWMPVWMAYHFIWKRTLNKFSIFN